MSRSFVWITYCTQRTYCVNALSISTIIYRVIQEETTIFWEVIISVILKKSIQGDSGEICNTLGNDSMCDSKQRNSYEHGSDFERLSRYGKKKIRTIL